MIQHQALYAYQPAASQMCYHMGENPNETVDTPIGLAPRWALYAFKMYEHSRMIECMRAYGLPT